MLSLHQMERPASDRHGGDLKLKERLADALIVAQEAVAHDHDHAYSSACQCYDDAVVQIEEVLKLLPPDVSSELALKQRKYRERASSIRVSLKEQDASQQATKRNGEPSPAPITFVDESAAISTQYMYIPPPPPKSPHAHPYWVSRMLATSIRRGGFLSESTYIPKAVWFQSTVSVDDQLEKMAACQFVAEDVLPKISSLSFGALDNAHQQLEHIATDLMAVQEYLAHAIGSDPPQQATRSAMREKKLHVQRLNRVREAISKRKEKAGDPACVDTVEYSTAVLAMLERIDPYEKWLTQSEKTNIAKMIEVLHKIGAFFDSCCKWILSDVCILVCHYQGKLMDDFLTCPELPADHDM